VDLVKFLEINKKQVKNQDSISKTNFFFSTQTFSPWAVLATWLHVVAPQKYKKMNLKHVINKTSPWAHMELEFDVLGVAKKLVKYVVNLSKRKKFKKIKFFTQATQTAIDQILVSRNFRN
jgi:hypothetical protein